MPTPDQLAADVTAAKEDSAPNKLRSEVELHRSSSARADDAKAASRAVWAPEYEPVSILPQATSYSKAATDSVTTTRNTSVSLNMIMTDQPMLRKSKVRRAERSERARSQLLNASRGLVAQVICTMGPKCWSEEGIGALLDAGLGVARFNFSHGEHAAHQEVLDRFRKVVAERAASGGKGQFAACLLDTKGPEVRTAMLKDGKDIELEAGQDIIVYAAGDEYTTFEGYKTESETKIGCSYAKLCQSVKPGNRLLFADGSVVIEVVEILDEKNLKGKVLNSKKLGQRKNGNLPGVKVDIPVLTEKDIMDIKDFAAKNKMDFVAASFVQTKEDILFIRKTLDEAGGQVGCLGAREAEHVTVQQPTCS